MISSKTCNKMIKKRFPHFLILFFGNKIFWLRCIARYFHNPLLNFKLCLLRSFSIISSARTLYFANCSIHPALSTFNCLKCDSCTPLMLLINFVLLLPSRTLTRFLYIRDKFTDNTLMYADKLVKAGDGFNIFNNGHCKGRSEVRYRSIWIYTPCI